MAGVFEQINGREDFGRELDRAKGICVEFLKNKLPGNPTLLSVQMQLEFFQGVMRSGRNPSLPTPCRKVGSLTFRRVRCTALSVSAGGLVSMALRFRSSPPHRTATPGCRREWEWTVPRSSR